MVLLRGVNVGGHRTFRPARLAGQLRHLDAVNLGAAGTFVIRRRVGRARLRAEFARRLPFAATIVICDGREIAALAARDLFAGCAERRDVVRFVSVLARAPRHPPATPLCLPSTGAWLVRVLGRKGRFVFGLHRRRMQAIGCLRTLDRVFGVPATTRSWNTIAALARVLGAARDGA